MTRCSSDIPSTVTNPSTADGCMGTGLRIFGPETTDTETVYDHGVPRLKGYFAVDVTGDLQRYYDYQPQAADPQTSQTNVAAHIALILAAISG